MWWPFWATVLRDAFDESEVEEEGNSTDPGEEVRTLDSVGNNFPVLSANIVFNILIVKWPIESEEFDYTYIRKEFLVTSISSVF